MSERATTVPRAPDRRGAELTTARLVLDDNGVALALYGERNGNLKIIERETGVELHARGNELTVIGAADAVAMTRRLVEQLYAMVRAGTPVSPEDIGRAALALRADAGVDLREVFSDTILIAGRARAIAPKGLAQKRYVDAIRAHDIVFGIGPAGTGKTYLAMALAVRALMEKQVKRIVLTRPAVEAGERLGFLPGSLEEKVSPYLRPLYDALHDMMDFEKADQLLARGLIEVAPIAFMRGRTLNDAFVILDEAQNTTTEQMKMFLTRLGFESKAVITGDVTQIDLPDNRRSGLNEAVSLLSGIQGIAFRYFTEVDVVRHPLVQEIIKAYDAKSLQDRAQDRASDRPK
ncbi:MAG TPA: PhoH family protein [Polyangia bacterium]|nr:PhoH family protein [Polyangia bacterium]